jgi:hypothetical protein
VEEGVASWGAGGVDPGRRHHVRHPLDDLEHPFAGGFKGSSQHDR